MRGWRFSVVATYTQRRSIPASTRPESERGVKQVVDDVKDLAEFGLDLIVDFAGFGTITAGAIEVVDSGGRVVQVGLGRSEATINTHRLTMKEVELRGSIGERPSIPWRS
ncbi:zinc-binding dehydrogenase [Rhodococcus opacus]|nr:zinc-binding dehydrogenase [Rhodococcus opacus]